MKDYPNPAAAACGGMRIGLGGRLCDPDGILSEEEAKMLQNALLDVEEELTPHACGAAMTGFQVAFALTRRIEGMAKKKKDPHGRSEAFAKHIHDTWGVGHAACNDGIVLFLSLDDREVRCYCAPAPWLAGSARRRPLSR